VRPDGVPLVVTAADLMVPTLLSSPSVTASHKYDGNFAWSGATSISQPFAGHTCSNWTSSSAAAVARMSETFRTQSDWLTVSYDEPCSNAHNLLCFEQ
jgi:hypothetical protein